MSCAKPGSTGKTNNKAKLEAERDKLYKQNASLKNWVYENETGRKERALRDKNQERIDAINRQIFQLDKKNLEKEGNLPQSLKDAGFKMSERSTSGNIGWYRETKNGTQSIGRDNGIWTVSIDGKHLYKNIGVKYDTYTDHSTSRSINRSLRATFDNPNDMLKVLDGLSKKSSFKVEK